MLKLRSIRLGFGASLLAVGLGAGAQTHHVDAPEEVVRAVSVYEWTGDLAKPTAARMVPVTVFIANQFQDGGTYYSRPIPLALLNGNIYSLEKAGVPQGNVTLEYARHLQPQPDGTGDNNDIGWFGYGTFAALKPERKGPALHAAAVTPQIASSKDKDNDRPTFVRRNQDGDASSKTSTANGSSKSSTTTTADTTATPDDPDRPHLSKPAAPKPDTTKPDTTSTDNSVDASTASTPAAASRRSSRGDADDPQDDSNRPTLRRRDPKQAEADRKAHQTSGVTAMGSYTDDPDRPTIKRGKAASEAAALTQLTGVPAELHQMVAVSDPATRQPHPFARDWESPEERADMLTKLEAVAQQQLADYARANAAAEPPTVMVTKPKSGTTTTRARKPAPVAPPMPVAAQLASEAITPYTLSYGGLPTFVYTAVSPPVPQPNAPAQPERYVTLVAQRLQSGELQVAFSSVTDAAHLDRTPWYRLIDAVDPDWEHRASLLFELRGQRSRQFGLYRILSAKAEQIFVTSPTE